MGQRLVFKMIRGDKTISTIYYHWSAYTDSCFMEALYLIKELRKRGYNKDMTDNETNLMLLHILLDNKEVKPYAGVLCGGPSDGDFKPFIDIGYTLDDKQMFNISRNQGLISIDEMNMKYYIRCGEYICDFNFDNETVNNNCIRVIPEDMDDYEPGFDISKINGASFPEYINTDGSVKWDDVETAISWILDIDKNHNSFICNAFDERGNSVSLELIN